MNCAVATPFTVRASVGETVPRLVENVTVVPFCTGVPELSSTVARSSAVPLACTTVLLEERAIVDRFGASRGTLSQLAAPAAPARRSAPHTKRFFEGRQPVIMENIR